MCPLWLFKVMLLRGKGLFAFGNTALPDSEIDLLFLLAVLSYESRIFSV